ncbi:MAG: 16S rRNA (guanine(527)-N(7))-methyltransferase RsmG [Nitrospirae bacterium]|nr:16S rRNA (guanine(527)-N(7))-methyltransferase RsmG [Nitrospirota bacterium]
MNEGHLLFERGLEQLGMPVTEAQSRAFSLYLAELKKWNRAYNLTALRTDSDIIIKHFLDSLLFLKVLPGSVRTVADIGSGAGFPGIPMKIMRPDLDMLLVEPSQKKTLFLEHILRTLRMEGIKVAHTRVEELEGVQVDAAVTRALFSIQEFIGKAEGILGGDGVLILSKGPKVSDEVKQVRGRQINRYDFVLPFQNSSRHLVVIRGTHVGPGNERSGIIV